MAINNCKLWLFKACQASGPTLCMIRRSLSTIHDDYLHPDVVLNPKNREECIRRLQSASTMVETSVKTKKAAVLVPLCIDNDKLGLLYTLRSTKLNTNGGQVSFPGGIRDDVDENFTDTACRETWEELQISRDKIEIWTQAALIGRKQVNVMPVLGYLGQINIKDLQINPQEVEEAFIVTLKDLCQPEYCRFTQFRNGFTLPAFTGGKYRIWGLTALITHTILKALVPDVYKHQTKFILPAGKNRKNSKPTS